jgi:hypothetical protein
MNDIVETPKKRGRPARKQELIRPTGPIKRSPSAHLNDPTIVPTTNLRVQTEQWLNGFDNDIELLALEIKARQDRKEDLERAREGCLALLSVLARDDTQTFTTNEDQS